MTTDTTFSYRNDFQNTFTTQPNAFSMSKAPDLESFTATGNPKPDDKEAAKGRSLNSWMTADSLGAGAPNLLPVRFTDESIVSVPVMPLPWNNDTKTFNGDSEDDEGPIKNATPKKRFSFSLFRRKSSSKTTKSPEFVMKDMTRGEYLKHYAKDNEGRYTGTQEPAPDCILNHKDDIVKYRRQFAYSTPPARKVVWSNEPVMATGLSETVSPPKPDSNINDNDWKNQKVGWQNNYAYAKAMGAIGPPFMG